jgi:hypothetical protein
LPDQAIKHKDWVTRVENDIESKRIDTNKMYKELMAVKDEIKEQQI